MAEDAVAELEEMSRSYDTPSHNQANKRSPTKRIDPPPGSGLYGLATGRGAPGARYRNPPGPPTRRASAIITTMSSNFGRLAHELSYARGRGCRPPVTLDVLWHDPH